MNAKQQNATHFHVHQPVRSGTLTLLITVVAVSLAVLAVLAVSTARADRAMAQKQLSQVQEQAEAERLGQEFLAKTDAALAAAGGNLSLAAADLPQGAVLDQNGTITASLPLSSGSAALEITLRQTGNAAAPRFETLRWALVSGWEPTEELTLWPGG